MKKTYLIIWFSAWYLLITLPIGLLAQPRIKDYKSYFWFKQLPSIDSSQYVKALDLSRQNLKILPDSIVHYTSLQAIDLSWNTSMDLKRALDVLAELPELEAVAIEGNNLTALPGNIRCLRTLQWLSVNNNELPRIRSSVFKLKNLRVLVLGYLGSRLDFGNRIQSCKTRRTLPHLKEIYLDANLLANIPDFVLRADSLEILSIGDNYLSAVPRELLQMKQLEFLNLAGNPIDRIPQEILYHFNGRKFFY